MPSSVISPAVRVYGDDFCDVQPNRVWSRRGAKGKNTFRDSGMAGFLHNQIPRRTVEPGNDSNVTIGFQSLEAEPIGRVDFKRRLLAALARRRHVFGAILAVLPGRSDAADENNLRVSGGRRRVKR